jgi:EKC/KEOPS complex subunit PCC1/LAGE3
LDVPLPSHRLASTALEAIRVDKELSPLVCRNLYLEKNVNADNTDQGQILKVEYKATTNRMLRVAVNSFMESLKLVVEVMEQLDVDVLEQKPQIHQPPS